MEPEARTVSTSNLPLANPFPLSPYPMHRFTVDRYHRMIQAGILTEDDPVELLEGWVVLQMPRNPPHDVCIDKTQELLRGLVPAGWRVRVQSAITLSDSEPEPDIVLAPGPAERYLAAHPGPQDVALLVEASDSSLARDRDDKGRIYARAGIGCYWIINLVDRRVEVYTNPSGPGPNPAFGQRQDYDENSSVPLALAGQPTTQVPVRSLLP